MAAWSPSEVVIGMAVTLATTSATLHPMFAARLKAKKLPILKIGLDA